MRVALFTVAVATLAVMANAFPHYAQFADLQQKQTDYLTTNAGAPIDMARSSQTVGAAGPVLLQDSLLIEKLQVQNRERIPERTVHARGALGKGVFNLTNDMSNYTTADFLNGAVGKQTPMALRFSTVIHGRDSPEFLRDPRGFALKFYTQQGNYDVVGLDFPIFFIRDGIRFPEMVRSLKPNPVTGVQEWWRIWDFMANYPESTHMFTWLLDDVGIPRSYREVDGYGVHTFKWINQAGVTKYVRYYFQSQQGVYSLNDDEATQQPFSFATADLYNHIANQTYPSWRMYVQLLDPATAATTLGFNPLDTTKQWPESIVPYIEVGEFTLNLNPASQFLENEQIALSPSRLVPGIEASDEKMLQARIFSYPDSQNYRLGINNQNIPINRPICPFRDAHQGGVSYKDPTLESEINYFPSLTSTIPHEAAPVYHDPEQVDGTKQRLTVEPLSYGDDFKQAAARYQSFDADRKSRFAVRVAATLSGSRISPLTVNTWLSYWQQVDDDLAATIQSHITTLQTLELEVAHHEPTLKHHRHIHQQARNFFRAMGATA